MNIKPAVLALSLALAPIALPVAMPAYGAVAMDFSPLVEQVSSGVVRVSITKKVSEEELALAQQVQALQQFFGGRVAVPNLPT